MKKLNKEVVKQTLTFLLYCNQQDVPIGPLHFYLPTSWDETEIDKYIALIFEQGKESRV